MSHEELLKEADRVIQPTIGTGSPFAILRDLAAALRAEMAANEAERRLPSAQVSSEAP